MFWQSSNIDLYYTHTHLICSDIKEPASSIIRACGKSLAIGKELQEKQDD